MSKKDNNKQVKKKSTKEKTTKKKKFKLGEDKVLDILIGVFLIITIFLILSLIIKGNTLSLKSDLVTELHNYFETDDLNNCGGFFNYDEELVNYDKVSMENKLCIAYHNVSQENSETETVPKLEEKNSEICKTEDNFIFRVNENTDECTITKIKKELIDNAYKKIFGHDITDNQEFKADNTHICYLKDDMYYCGLSETYTYIYGNGTAIYRVLDKAIKKGSRVYLYDYFANITGDTCYQNYSPKNINQECTDNYQGENKMDLKFMKQYTKKYEHIYEKNADGSYHWVSSKLVEE